MPRDGSAQSGGGPAGGASAGGASAGGASAGGASAGGASAGGASAGGASAGSNPPAARRTPVQQRSRERFERILGVTSALIAERGSESLRMSEVAEQAGISMGSLYQYFPDKTSIIRTLAERYNALGRECVAGILAVVQREGELGDALLQIVNGFHEMYLAEPVMRDIWNASQSDKALQELDAADVEEHARLLADTLVRLRPRANAAALTDVSRTLMHLMASGVRFAIAAGTPDEGAVRLAVLKQLMPADPFDLLHAMRVRREK